MSSPKEALNLALVLAEHFGGSVEVASQRLSVYLPNKDRDDSEFDVEPWVREARELLTAIGGGATALPAADGTWENNETKAIVWESTRMIYTFIRAEALRLHLPQLTAFLRRFGEQTGQGEVVVEFGSYFYRIPIDRR